MNGLDYLEIFRNVAIIVFNALILLRIGKTILDSISENEMPIKNIKNQIKALCIGNGLYVLLEIVKKYFMEG